MTHRTGNARYWEHRPSDHRAGMREHWHGRLQPMPEPRTGFLARLRTALGSDRNG